MLTSLREGLTAIRMSNFLSKIQESRGEAVANPGCLILLKTGNQCTVAGSGELFDKFRRTGELKEYGGNASPVSFYADNFETAAYRILKFDQTFYKMPYDCRNSEYDGRMHRISFIQN